MPNCVIAFDLGTSGNKAALYHADGTCLAETFQPYPTRYPSPGRHEQHPQEWWQAVVASIRRLLAQSRVRPADIAACGISGHSLGAVPVDSAARLLRAETPIWSDSRAVEQARRFFGRVDQRAWYNRTGNGFPPPLYTLFKILWYRDHDPEILRSARHILGTKDYINLRLTGVVATDYSYASGCGAYDLNAWDYAHDILSSAGLPRDLFPPLYPSSAVIGTVGSAAAEETGLTPGMVVVAGGVDNSCMALGAGSTRPGRIYNSQGSSSWIALTAEKPLLDAAIRPFVFAHVLPGLFNSAIGIFSTGTSLRWVRDQLCPDLVERSRIEQREVYDLIMELAETSPPGANGVLFHPNLAGGSSLDPSPRLRGAFLNLDLAHTRADLLRATLEGIALQGRVALDALRSLYPAGEELVVVGGGGRSPLWRQIHADAYGLRVVKTPVDQQAAALGAAALAFIGAGLWPDASPIIALHTPREVHDPDPIIAPLYERLLPLFKRIALPLAELGANLNDPST
jgi:xylulokinase